MKLVLIVVTLLVGVVALVSRGCEGDAAEDFGEFGFAEHGELLIGGFGGVGVAQVVGDGYEAVGVCALVAVAADGGGDAVDSGFAVFIGGAGDVADAVGCGRPGEIGDRVIACGVIADHVGDAEVGAALQ